MIVFSMLLLFFVVLEEDVAAPISKKILPDTLPLPLSHIYT